MVSQEMENQTGNGREFFMNTLFLNSAKSWGGNEHWTALAAHGLAGRNEVYLAYRNENIGQRFKITKRPLPFLNELDVYTIFRLIYLVKKWEIDIVIPTKRKDYVLAGLAAKVTGIKNVIRLGIERQLKNTWVNRLVYNSLCNGIIVNAESIKDKLKSFDFISPGKICVIYNGVDFPTIREKAIQKNGFIKPFDFTIVAMGELSRRKGFDLLLKAFSIIKKKIRSGISCGVLIIGAGPEKQNLEKLAHQLEINENVVFTGFLENPYPLIAESDIFVHTSKQEGIPNAMLEAMALKRPVITAEFGAAREVIQNGSNGYVLEHANTNELADRLTELINNQNNRETIATEGFHSVNKIFSKEKMIHKIEEFCSQV